MSQQWKVFKQLYNLKVNNLSLCSAVLLSGNLQSEHVAAVEWVQQRYYWNLKTLSYCRTVLLSGNVQYEHVAAVESVETTILSEH